MNGFQLAERAGKRPEREIRAEHLLMAARRYVDAYFKEENYHPQAREAARDLRWQIDEFLQHTKD